MKILVIEDDSSVSEVIELIGRQYGMIFDITALGEDGIEFSRLYDYDLIVLDIMLPDIDGYEVLKRIREAGKEVPILILSGLGDPEEKIKGLGFGADDYLTKPFNKEELIARIQAIVRRSKGHNTSVIKAGHLEISIQNHSTTFKGQAVRLTNKEQAILEIMALRKGNILSKEMLIEHLYNGMDEPEAKIIDVFICKLRRKIMNLSNGVDYIETIWGRGYALKDIKNEA
jgi:two-component system cell cycle response regulator CtrA